MKVSTSSLRCRGFTLIETLITVSIMGILSSIAYPSYVHVLHKVRRCDARVVIMLVQSAQEHYRSNHTAYGNLADIKLGAVSPAGHYELELSNVTSTGYELRAQATGAQASDRDCSHLKVTVNGLRVSRDSGRDERFANADAVNRKCWGA